MSKIMSLGVRGLLAVAVAAAPLAAAHPALAATDYPLYCQGLVGVAEAASGDQLGGPQLYKLKWANAAASVAVPGQGECAWADRAPRGAELSMTGLMPVGGDGGQIQGLRPGQFIELGVHASGQNLVIDEVIGIVSPPFSSSVALPPTPPPAPLK